MSLLSRYSSKFSIAMSFWREESRQTLSLAVPLALTHLTYIAIVTTDVVMMGWLGTDAIAAGTLAGHFFTLFSFACMGVLAAVAPIVAQHLGGRRYREVRRAVRQGFWVSIVISIPSTLIILQVEPILVFFGQKPALAAAGQAYLVPMVVGFLPGLWRGVLNQFLTAHKRPRAVFVITVFGVGLNATANYGLMFGNFGLPRLELVGAGISSATVTIAMLLATLMFVLRDRRLRRYRLFGRFWRPDWPAFLEIFRVGVPIALTDLAEMGMFLVLGLLMGTIGTAALAAHAIAGQCCAVAYMVPLGFSRAATVRVGRAIGAGQPQIAARAGWNAVSLSVIFGILPALAFWFFGESIALFFLDPGSGENRTAINLAVVFLIIAGFFQVADSAQIALRGALQGLKDTGGPMAISVAAYWGLAIPGAALSSLYLDFGGEAIWMSMAISITLVAFLLVWRLRVKLEQQELAPA